MLRPDYSRADMSRILLSHLEPPLCCESGVLVSLLRNVAIMCVESSFPSVACRTSAALGTVEAQWDEAGNRGRECGCRLQSESNNPQGERWVSCVGRPVLE